MDQIKKLGLLCPEHNMDVEWVCLANACYQKLLCDACLKKHKAVHKNDSLSLSDFLNYLRTFVNIRLKENDDGLSDFQDQIRMGERVLRQLDGKPSEINGIMLQCVNGKDFESKYLLFNEKAQKLKANQQSKEIQNVTNELALFAQDYQKRILNLQKKITESVQLHLKKGTSRELLFDKSIKDISINILLSDLISCKPHERYNMLSKNLQKLHKGFLELKQSKISFRQICEKTRQAFQSFTSNLSNFFDEEYKNLFSFLLDPTETLFVNDTITSQTVNSPMLSPIYQHNQTLKIPFSNLQSFPNLQSSSERQTLHPNQMLNQMVQDLQNISKDTRITTANTSHYPQDSLTRPPQETEMQSVQKFLSSHLNLTMKTPSRNNTFSSLIQKESIIGKNIPREIITARVSPISKENSKQENMLSTKQLQRYLDFQKRESIINIQKIEINRFTHIKKNILLHLTRETSVQNKNPTHKKSVSELISINDQTNKESNHNILNIFPSIQQVIQLCDLTYFFAVPKKYSQNASESVQNISKSLFGKKSAHFRFNSMHRNLTTTTTQNTSETIEGTIASFQREQADDLEENTNNFTTIISKKTNYKSCNLLSLLTYPYLRTFGYLDQLKLDRLILCHPFSQNNISENSKTSSLVSSKLVDQSQLISSKAVDQSPLISSKVVDQSSLISQKGVDQSPLISSKGVNQSSLVSSKGVDQSSLISSSKGVELPRHDNSILINPCGKQEAHIIIGLQEIAATKFFLITQSGEVQIWQVSLSATGLPSVQKIQEIQLCESIQCYSDVSNLEKAENIAESKELDPLLLIGGKIEEGESRLFILRYYIKKNKFFEIESLPDFHGTRGAITCLQISEDKIFKKDKINSRICQLITDICYTYSLNLFDNDSQEKSENMNDKQKIESSQYQSNERNMKQIYQQRSNIYKSIQSSNYTIKNQQLNVNEDYPSILVQRIQFHREKHGFFERSFVTKIQIQPQVIISKLLYDDMNECIWGHSDQMLFKWIVNLEQKCMQSNNYLAVCTSPEDIITSMECNKTSLVISTLQGSIFAFDLMLNKIFQKDCHRFLFSAIHDYQKFQGKSNNIYVLSGQKIKIYNNTVQLLTLPLGIIPVSPNQFKIVPSQNRFLFSTLSSSGIKLFSFDTNFKEVLQTVLGQKNHIQQIVYMQKNNLLIAVEDLNQIRIFHNITL